MGENGWAKKVYLDNGTRSKCNLNCNRVSNKSGYSSKGREW